MIAYSTPYMLANIKYGTFLFFGSSLVVGFIFAYYFLQLLINHRLKSCPTSSIYEGQRDISVQSKSGSSTSS